MNEQSFTENFCCKNDRKGNVATFTKDGIDMIVMKVSQSLEESAEEEEAIFYIFEKS